MQVTEQSRRQSAIETAVSTSLGLVGSLIIVFTTFSLIEDKTIATTATTLLCTVWSVVRGYRVRRWFAHRAAVAGGKLDG